MKILILLAIFVVATESCTDLYDDCRSYFCSSSYWRNQCRNTCNQCQQCGISKVKQGRVVNGDDAQEGAWPWIASLRYYNSHFCGGTLITAYWVLTASHCVENRNSLRGFKVVLGEHNRAISNSYRQTIDVAEIIMHQGYKVNGRRNFGNDIALLRLARPAKLNDRVALGCLPKQQGVYPQTGKKCYIAGWGTTDHPGSIPNVLQQAKLPIVKRGHKGCHYKKDMVCVGLGFDQQNDGKQHPNACRGDSGGPLACENSDGSWTVEGVASYVYTYCKYYTAYTAINDHLDWVKNHIK